MGEKRVKKISLAWQIFIGLILGIILGAIFYRNPHIEQFLQPIGNIFLRLIKMIVVPIVISCLVVGVAGAGDMKSLGKLGGKTLLYFEIITTIAIVVGLLVANIFHPGTGVDRSQLVKSDISSYVTTEKATESHSHIDTLVNIVPTNVVQDGAN